MTDDADFVAHEPCPKCGSEDNLARYTDGHGYCFGCKYYEPGEGQAPTSTTEKRVSGLIPAGEVRALDKRRINEATCAKWGYTVGTMGDKTVQIANYRDEAGHVIAQKVRFPNKEFTFLGDTKAVGLYGQNLWRDGGKMVVVTEGEIDALSVSQLQDNRWPVVSVPNGAQGAAKSIRKNLEWLDRFESVIFMFDNDEHGRKAAAECAEVLRPGRAKIATLPLKDANDMLKAGRGKEVIDAIWGAKVYRPDGIVSGADLWDSVSAPDDNQVGALYPWQGLNEKTRGARPGEVITVTAGSGVGKSAAMREIAHHLHKVGETVGMVMLEEPVKRTALGLMAIELNKPIHIHREGTNEEELRVAFEATVGTGRLFLYDHFGSTEIDNLLARIRYLAKGCGCRFVILDHLSIVISGQDDGDERRMIDNAMTALKSLAMECNVCIFLVSHLRRPAGDKGHENGAETSLSQLRGSHAIAQLSDFVIGLERDQQCDDPDVTIIRVLKNRFTGETGVAGWLRYDRDTGRLTEVIENPFKDGGDGDGEAEPF